MEQKSRTNQNQWSIQGAKDKKEQERVRQMLIPPEQNAKKGPGRPSKVKNEKGEKKKSE
mgnify:CR=1 FL=1